MTVKKNISVYSNYPDIRKIKNLCVPKNKFDLPSRKYKDIKKKKNKKLNHLTTATVRPIFKKDDRAKIKNYRP